MGCFVPFWPPLLRGGGRSNLSAASRCCSLLLSISADVRSSGDVIAFEGGVFATLVKVAILHFLWMWISLTLFDRASFAVTLSLLSAVAGVVPIVPAPMLALPTAVELWYFSDKIDALCFFFLHLYLWWDLAPRLYVSCLYMTAPFARVHSRVGINKVL